jgi:pilus assembly protein CpaE
LEDEEYRDQLDRRQLMSASMNHSEQIAPLPRISVQAFCESPEIAQIIQEALADRRMEKAHVKVHMGGAMAAIEAYRGAATPNVIVLETNSERGDLVNCLEQLSEFCDAGTKVVVIGRMNDILLYRDLMARGVSEYIVVPFHVLDFIRAISHLYGTPGAEPVGRVTAITGAKGGVGASTIAHNIAWSIAHDLEIQTALVDLDLGFGTAGLDFNQDPPQGIAEAVFAPDRVDANLVDRLLSRCGDRLSILAAPATLDRVYDFPDTAFDAVIDILRASTPSVVLDIPHVWTAWARRMLLGADEVLLVAAPDLANLRNAKSLLDTMRQARPNDAPPRLILNMVGVPKRPEIAISDFVKAVDLSPAAVIAFEPKLFGTAANNGQMIAEIEPASKINEALSEIARTIAGRSEARKAKRNLLDPLMFRLGRKKAS